VHLTRRAPSPNCMRRTSLSVYRLALLSFLSPQLRLMNRRFVKDIHHLLGLPVPSAYNRSMSLAASS